MKIKPKNFLMKSSMKLDLNHFCSTQMDQTAKTCPKIFMDAYPTYPNQEKMLKLNFVEKSKNRPLRSPNFTSGSQPV